MDNEKKGFLLVALSALFIATEVIFAKLAYDSGVGVVTTITMRFTLACIILMICLYATGQKLRSPDDRKLLYFLIIIYASVAAMLFEAFALLPASLAIMFLYAYPSLTGILSYFIDKERLSREKILALALSALGLVLLLWSSWNNVSVLGVFLALGAAFANSFYLIYSPKILKRVSELSLLSWLFLSCSIFYWATGLLSGSISFDFSSNAWFYLIGLGLISTAAATLALIYGLPLIGATRAAIVNTLELPFTAFLAFLVFEEVLTPVQFAGALLILLAVIIPQIPKRKVKAPKRHDKVFS